MNSQAQNAGATARTVTSRLRTESNRREPFLGLVKTTFAA